MIKNKLAQSILDKQQKSMVEAQEKTMKRLAEVLESIHAHLELQLEEQKKIRLLLENGRKK